MSSDNVAQLLSPFAPEVRRLAMDLRSLVGDVEPEAAEELDVTAKLIGFTFIPGTYKGLFVAIAPQRSHVNLMFSRGVDLAELDTTGLLEGTGEEGASYKVPRSRTTIRPPGAQADSRRCRGDPPLHWRKEIVEGTR